MKITEHIDELIVMEKFLTTLNNENLSKEIIDSCIVFTDYKNKIEFSALFEHQRPNLIYREYKAKLSNLKNLLTEKGFLFKYHRISSVISTECSKEESIYNSQYKVLRQISDKRLELNGRLESWCMRYSEESEQMIELRKEYEEINNEYKKEREYCNSLYNDWGRKERKLDYLYGFHPQKMIEKIEEIEFAFSSLSVFEKYLDEVFVNGRVLGVLYDLFVGLDLIEFVEFLDFVNQMAGKDLMAVQKKRNTDKFIAYAINRVAIEFIKPAKKAIWRDEMVTYFDINDFEKKINPSSKNKVQLHKEIDAIINSAKHELL
ncbi:hypothetical protein [uncultured Chryseobacterium sp.]|uniref:hypothetical protein n=1 Tax=uncultured Chryseobacterium sp. TaxID=259322 RepID=UPI00260B4796|nr:hypothetical protein [uncultured Chryseobacterium sp.]